jgi:hypothetical protein
VNKCAEIWGISGRAAGGVISIQLLLRRRHRPPVAKRSQAHSQPPRRLHGVLPSESGGEALRPTTSHQVRHAVLENDLIHTLAVPPFPCRVVAAAAKVMQELRLTAPDPHPNEVALLGAMNADELDIVCAVPAEGTEPRARKPEDHPSGVVLDLVLDEDTGRPHGR